MSRKIPEPIRAVAGLAVTFLDEARRLPSTIPGLPVRFLSLAMQATMKMQQQYAGLVARGDELFTGLRGRHEPGLATFDEDLPVEEPVRSVRSSAFDRATVPDESRDAQIAEKAADDELLGLPPEVAPEEVVASVHDITEQVREATVEVTAAPSTADLGLSTEDALESALLEAESAPSDGGLVDRDLLAESLPGEDVTADVSTEVDVLTPAGEVATVEGTVTDEGVAAPEAPAQETGRRRAAAARAGAVTAQEAAVDEALGSGDEVRAGSRGAAPAPTATVSDDHEHTGEGDEVVTRGGAAVDDALGSDDGSPAAGREVVTEPEAAVEEALGAQAGEEQRAAASPTPGRAAAADDHEATGQGAEVVTGAAASVDEAAGAEAGGAETRAGGEAPDIQPGAAERAQPVARSADQVSAAEEEAEAVDEGGTAVAAGTGHAVDLDEALEEATGAAEETRAGGEAPDIQPGAAERAQPVARSADQVSAAEEEAEAVDEGGTAVAAGTGHAVDLDEALEEATGAAEDTEAGGGGTEAGGGEPRAQAAGTAPVEGYDNFTVAQLRGRLRGYQVTTVRDLIAYEEATRARDPFLRLLRNRLERLERLEAENVDPALTPRGM